jgi:hypothetical protein
LSSPKTARAAAKPVPSASRASKRLRARGALHKPASGALRASSSSGQTFCNNWRTVMRPRGSSRHSVGTADRIVELHVAVMHREPECEASSERFGPAGEQGIRRHAPASSAELQRARDA